MRPIITRFLFPSLLITGFLFTLSEISAQETSTELTDFKIEIQRDGAKVIMNCASGCAWSKSSYQNTKPFQAIDEFGMTDVTEKTSNSSGLTDFLFLVVKTDEGIDLRGLRGTAWTELSFTLNDDQTQTIDQYGMTD